MSGVSNPLAVEAVCANFQWSPHLIVDGICLHGAVAECLGYCICSFGFDSGQVRCFP